MSSTLHFVTTHFFLLRTMAIGVAFVLLSAPWLFAQTSNATLRGRIVDSGGVLLSFARGADATDGLEVTSASLGPDFPDGALVAMNSAHHNFLILRWKDIAAAATPPLQSATTPPSSALH